MVCVTEVFQSATQEYIFHLRSCCLLPLKKNKDEGRQKTLQASCRVGLEADHSSDSPYLLGADRPFVSTNPEAFKCRVHSIC